MSSNCSCKPRKKRTTFKSPYLSFIAGLFIALLPKCPFCILAYSSAITLCSGKTLYNHDPGWTSFISIALALFTLVVILLNYKGRKTIIAAILVLIGSLFLIYSEMYTGDIYQYYWGTAFLLLGVWLNANLMYFYQKCKVLFFNKNSFSICSK